MMQEKIYLLATVTDTVLQVSSSFDSWVCVFSVDMRCVNPPRVWFVVVLSRLLIHGVASWHSVARKKRLSS